MIILKRPRKEYESEAADFKQEFIDNGETTIKLVCTGCTNKFLWL